MAQTKLLIFPSKLASFLLSLNYQLNPFPCDDQNPWNYPFQVSFFPHTLQTTLSSILDGYTFKIYLEFYPFIPPPLLALVQVIIIFGLVYRNCLMR